MSGNRLTEIIASPVFLVIAGIGALLSIIVCWLMPNNVQIALVAILLSVVVGLLVVAIQRSFRHADDFDALHTPMTLAKDEEVYGQFESIAESLKEISQKADPIFRDLALQRTTQMSNELAQVAEGRIVFVGTETWRMAYERLLRSPGLHLYRSIAHVKTANYWQDEPGRQSMQLNFELHDDVVIRIERICIFPDHLWPTDEWFPIEPLNAWVEEQHNHGIWIKLVRESEIAGEPDLLVDLGIYGNRAVGIQELDDKGHTVRFTLSFDFAEVLAAEKRWERLSLYSTSYRKLLDQFSSGE